MENAITAIKTAIKFNQSEIEAYRTMAKGIKEGKTFKELKGNHQLAKEMEWMIAGMEKAEEKMIMALEIINTQMEFSL